MINWSDFPSDSLLHLPASTRPSSVHISHISTRFPHLMIYVLMSQSIIFAFQSEYPLFPSLRWPRSGRKKILFFSRAQVNLVSGLPFFLLHFNDFFLLFFNFLPWFCQIYLSHLKSEEYLSEESALPHFPP